MPKLTAYSADGLFGPPGLEYEIGAKRLITSALVIELAIA